jgi:hypothetical protein
VNEDLGRQLVRVFLRFFRSGVAMEVRDGRAGGDLRDLLLLHWSISSSVSDLVDYAREHPHELRSALASRTTISRGIVRGRIIAGATSVLQTVTADPSLFVLDEPFRSFSTGPNRVLGWTLRQATKLARRFRALLPEEATYFERTVAMLTTVQDVRRLLPTTDDAQLGTPTPGDVRVARSSRVLLYRKAAAAYEEMRAVERGDPDAVERLLSDTLVGPMDIWMQFELFLALAMADAIGTVLDIEPQVEHLMPGGADVLIGVGPYAVCWQRAGPNYRKPALDAWEQRIVEMLTAYGVSAGYYRPDVVVYNRTSGNVLAIGEAKYFASDNWRDRLRDAATQIVNYARGYESSQDVEALIRRSVIALWETAGGPTPHATAPFVATFASLSSGISSWASTALSGGRDAPPSAASGTSSAGNIAGG